MELQASWYHTTKGQYFPDTQVVGIDFNGGLFGSKQAFDTLIHETVHAFLCSATEMGIFLQDLEKHKDELTQLSQDDKKRLFKLLFKSQQAVQEGFATFSQFGVLRKELTRAQQKHWLAQLPDTYQNWLKPFLFAFKLTAKQRDFLMRYLVRLSMNTHIRKDAESFHLLENVTALENYLKIPDNNPNYRLKTMLKAIKKNPTILNLPEEKIAPACRLKHFPPISKQDISDFVFYASTQMGNPTRLSENEIGDAIDLDQVFSHVQDNTIVANMNMNFKEGEFLYKTEDVIHYSDVIETIVIGERGKRHQADIQVLRHLFDEEPEISFLMQTKTGEKYMHMTSKSKATELLNNELKDAVLGVKLLDYDFETDSAVWLDGCRPLDLVIFNHHWQLKKFFENVLKFKPDLHITYCNMGPVEDHPYRSFLCTINGKNPVIGVNTMIPKQAEDIIYSIANNSTSSANEFVKSNKNAVNSWLIFWTGWDFRIDWVETMLDGKDLHFKY